MCDAENDANAFPKPLTASDQKTRGADRHPKRADRRFSVDDKSLGIAGTLVIVNNKGLSERDFPPEEQGHRRWNA